MSGFLRQAVRVRIHTLCFSPWRHSVTDEHFPLVVACGANQGLFTLKPYEALINGLLFSPGSRLRRQPGAINIEPLRGSSVTDCHYFYSCISLMPCVHAAFWGAKLEPVIFALVGMCMSLPKATPSTITCWRDQRRVFCPMRGYDRPKIGGRHR